MSVRAYSVLVAAFFTVFIAYAIRYGYGLLLPEMLPSMGISKTEAGAIYASYFVAYTVFSPILGHLSDRFSVRYLLTAFSAMMACGALLMALIQSVVEASFYFTLAGIGHAACWAPVVALVQRWVSYSRRGTALAFATLGSGVGIAAWSFLLPPIVAAFGWQGGWIGMGLFGLLVAAMNFVLVRDPLEHPRRKAPSPGGAAPLTQGAHYAALLTSTRFWSIGLSYMFVGFTVLVPYTFIGVYAREELLLAYTASARFISVIALSGLVGKVILGILSDHLGRIKIMVICGMLLSSGCWGMVHVSDVLFKYGFAGLFGLGFGAVWPVYAAAAADFFPESVTGSVIGLWTFLLGVGSIVSPVVCGWTIDLTGSFTWTFHLGAAGGVLTILFLLPMARAVRQQQVGSSFGP